MTKNVDAEALSNASDAEFAAFFEKLSIEEFDAWTEKLYRGKRTDGKRALIDAKFSALASYYAAKILPYHLEEKNRGRKVPLVVPLSLPPKSKDKIAEATHAAAA
jgi:hypothetical protein